ncbi:MAG: glycosyltransferase family 4 protein [Alphaproteobacteria bacterium]|jgi:glycosyltransferase involved in cell wall biosynthesis|nr:glycosyltransferase family 4 protein [Alphaproteobacteria bacterium]
MTIKDSNESLPSTNILIVLKDLNDIQEVTYVKDLATFLKSQDINPVIISNKGPLISEFARHGLKHIYAPINKTGFFNERIKARLIEKICENENIHLIHNFSRSAVKATFKVHTKLSLPLIHSMNKVYKGNKRFNAGLLKSDFTITASEYIKEKAIHKYKNYIQDKKNLVVINNWVDTLKYSKASISAARIENVIQKINLPEDKKIIIIPEDIEKESGLKTILSAIKESENKDKFLALIVGKVKNEKYLTALERIIREEGLEESIRISFNSEDFLELLAMSNLAIFPSKIKKYTNDRITKAQSMGVPVIANDRGVNNELIVDGLTGFIIDDKHVEDITLAIDNIITMEEMNSRRLSMESLKFAKVNFEYKTKCAEILELYQKAIKFYK